MATLLHSSGKLLLMSSSIRSVVVKNYLRRETRRAPVAESSGSRPRTSKQNYTKSRGDDRYWMYRPQVAGSSGPEAPTSGQPRPQGEHSRELPHQTLGFSHAPPAIIDTIRETGDGAFWRDKIVNYAQQNPGKSQLEIASDLGTTRGRVQGALQSTRTPHPGVLTPRGTHLTPLGEQMVAERSHLSVTNAARDLGINDTVENYRRKVAGKTGWGPRKTVD
jgi:hypothetical protein